MQKNRDEDIAAITQIKQGDANCCMVFLSRDVLVAVS